MKAPFSENQDQTGAAIVESSMNEYYYEFKEFADLLEQGK